MTRLFAIAAPAAQAALAELDRLAADDPPYGDEQNEFFEAERLQVHLHMVLQAWLGDQSGKPPKTVGAVMRIAALTFAGAISSFGHDLANQATPDNPATRDDVVRELMRITAISTTKRLAAMQSADSKIGGIEVTMQDGVLREHVPDFRDRLGADHG
jgi:hypothetical protein